MDLKYWSSLHKLSSFTFTLKRVAQFVTSTMLSFPPRPSKINKINSLSFLDLFLLFFCSLYSFLEPNFISSSSSRPGVLKSNFNIKNLNTTNHINVNTKPV